MKQLDKLKRGSYVAPFITFSIVGLLFLMFYNTLDKPLEKILVLMVGFSICVPFSIIMFKHLFGSLAKELKKERDSNPYTRFVDAKGMPILKKDYYKNNYKKTQEESKVKKEEPKRKSKVVTTVGYQELKNVIIATSKNKLLNRETILEFKAELRNRLGVHYECYKNMTFKNDLHEIYTLIKSSKFTTEDYNEMTEWISNHLNLDNIS